MSSGPNIDGKWGPTPLNLIELWLKLIEKLVLLAFGLEQGFS